MSSLTRPRRSCARHRAETSPTSPLSSQLPPEAIAGAVAHPGLAGRSIEIMRRLGVSVDVVRAVDHEIAHGVYPDMTEHGWERDDWPSIFERVMAADILVVMTPIWLGEKSSVCRS